MKINNELIKVASTALFDSKIVDDNGEYNSCFKSYISSFGAAVVQSGLLPAVIFFGNIGDTQADKTSVINAIVYILKATRGLNITDNNLAAYIINNNKYTDNQFLKQVTSAAVALKLALRMYKPLSRNE